MVKRISLALSRARADLAPAVAGWGTTKLLGVTANRSLEAHLADHGIQLNRGQGRPDQDPDGAAHTIDPNVDVLRVDRLSGGPPRAAGGVVDVRQPRDRQPLDLHVLQRRPPRLGRPHLRGRGAASGTRPARTAGRERVRQQRRRRHLGRPRRASAPRTPRRSAATRRGRCCAAWRHAGRALSPRPRLELRWTRVCFCGQATPLRPARRPRGLRRLLPDRLRGGARAAVRGDRRHLRGPAAGRARRRPGGQGPGAQRQRPHARADLGSAHRRAARRPPDRDDPGRGDLGAGPPDAQRRARRHARQRHPSCRGRRLRERVRLLLHDARGVRRPALRGRHDRLRPG